MHTNRLTIRRFHRSDSDKLYKLISDKEVMRFLEPPYSREKSEAFLHAAGLSDNPLIYAVDDKEGNFIGYVIYHVYEEKSYEIGWVLYKQEWNKGYAQELTKLLIDDAKKKNRNLIIECLPEQIATKKIALSNGFEYCGNIDQCDVYLLKMD